MKNKEDSQMAQPKKPRAKKFSLKSVEKQFKAINTYSNYEVAVNGNKETIRYYKIFDDVKIEELLKEAGVNLEYDRVHQIGFFKDDGILFHYLLFLTIRYFTELFDAIPSNLEEQIPMFNQFRKTGLYKDLINNMFDPNETGKVIEYFTEFITLNEKLTELESETRLKALETVQHPVVKKKLQEGKFDAKV